MQLFWFELSALVVLLLLLRLRWRLDAKRAANEQDTLPRGHGFDAAPVQALLKKVRQDYSAVAVLRSRQTPNHDLIVMAVRRSLVKLSYFRSAQSKDPETVERSSHEASE